MQFINYNLRNYNMKMQCFIALKCINTQQLMPLIHKKTLIKLLKRLWEEFLVTDKTLKGRPAEQDP